MKTRILRYGLLTIILGLVIHLALGYGERSFEAYCPFGGMESLWGLFKQGEYSCALGPLNLSLLVALLVLALIAKKAFCGWACPIGYLSELTGRLGGLFQKNRLEINGKVNGRLKLLRYVVLIVSLYFTYKLGELVLRGYDPFYVIFSGFGHGTAGWITYATLAVIIVGAFFVPMFFCRYLCPLGATFDPLSRLGLIKIVRNEDLCTQCGDCSAACPHDLRPHEVVKLRHRDCTNCLECVDACPVSGSLDIKATF
jgi:NapH/MauN family ferredoxin-type protein